MAGKEKLVHMNFRLGDTHKEMILGLGVKYRTSSMTEVLKRIIEKEYAAQVLNSNKEKQL